MYFNCNMKTVLIIFALTISVSICQVSPLWSESPSVQTGTRIIVSSQMSTTASDNFTTTYTKSMSGPWIGLSIRQLRIVSNNQQIQFKSFIVGLPQINNVNFVHNLNRFAPSQIYYFEIGWIAYEGGLPAFNDIDVYYLDTATATPNTGINGPTDTTQTYKWNPGGLTITTGHTFVLAAFTTGYKGTMSPTGFQVNITSIQVSNPDNVQIAIAVSSQTILVSIQFYVMICDMTGLEVHSWTFVEGYITTAKNGVQNTFYTPSEVLFTKNYLAGLRSFSQANNKQYNFTISGLNFTTRTDSLYNDVTHLNIWARVCPVAYPVYNTVDKLCYAFCPTGTYLVSQYALCRKCDSTCTTCTNNTSCTTCAANRVLDGSGLLCICAPYYYEYQGICTPCHYSCYSCQHSGQIFNCDSCNDLVTNRALPAGVTDNSTCGCKTGYYDSGTAVCTAICGDGLLNGAQCDDNNTNDNDGCSSTCMQQPYFWCDTTSSPTPCYFIGQLTIQITRIQKDPNTNKATFFLSLSPSVKIMSQLTSANMITNITGAVFDSFAVVDNYITYTIAYGTSFQDTVVVFGLRPNPSGTGILSKFAPKNATLVAKASNGLLLNYYDQADYTDAIKLGTAANIVGIIIFAFGFLFCYGDLKQIGLQLIFTVQLMFMTSVVLINFDPYITRYLYIKHVMGYNDIMGQQKPPYMAVPVTQHMGYSVGYQYNFNIMVIMPAFSLLMYIIYRIAFYRHQNKLLAGLTSKKFDEVLLGKILNYFKFDLFVYWMLFSMQQVLMGLALQSQYIENGVIYLYIVLCLVGVVVSVLGLFLRPASMQVYRKVLFHKSYGSNTFLMVLVSTLIMDILLLLSVLVSRQIFYVLLVIPVFITIYIIARRPFLSHWNNIRLVILQLCLIVVIVLQIVIINTGYSSNKKYSIGIIICIGIAFLVTLIVWIYFIIKKICKLRKSQDVDISSKYSSKYEEESINQKVRQAGFALVHGNTGVSRLPTIYQMRTMPNKSRLPKIQSYRVKPTQREEPASRRYAQQASPATTNIRDRINDNSNIRTTNNASRLTANKGTKGKANNNSGSGDDYDDNKVDETSPMKDTGRYGAGSSSARKLKDLNPYKQILEETVRYK